MAMAAILLLFLTLFSNSKADQDFDIRQHLSTVTRYGAVKDIVDSSFSSSDIPDACTPLHLNLVARHGTRSPTKKRMRELEKLASHIRELVKEANYNNVSLQKVPAWLQQWESPWKGKLKGGQLDRKGEEELYQLGIRVRERFPDIFNEEYHPDVYPIRTTHDYRKNHELAVNKMKEPILVEITSALVKRYEFKFTIHDISSLWFLSKQESSLLDITDQACSLFSPTEVALLEWMDDLEVFILKGYGNALNYRIGVPLLKDVVQSMDQAIKAKEDNHAPGSYEKARLRFAHAETVVPFSCLLGLFLEGSDFERIQKEEPLNLPPKPPQNRKWRGSIVAPFAGNNMLVLYSCPANFSSKYAVQVIHNEHPIPIPGCDGTDFCPFEVFKERIVRPHLKHDYNTLCNVNLDHSKQKPETM
ncbi:hypothetical protein DITRI_Ditri02bG0123500 [Diplodiscus trichospermus]